MNDLFTRLAQRALADAGPTIRAPAEPDPGPLVEEAGWTESTDLSDLSESTVPTVSTVPALDPPTGPSPAAEGAPQRPDHDRARPAAVAASVRPSVAADGTAETRTARLVPAPSTLPPAREYGVSGEVGPPAGEASIGTGRPVPDTGRPGSTGAVRNGRHGLTPVTDSVLRPAVSPEPPAIAPPRERTAPPVEVTIGRLEISVRPAGTTGGSGSPRRGEPAPALSLEEYLRRREGTP